LLGLIGSNPLLDFRHFNDTFHVNDPLANPYSEINLTSSYFDNDSFVQTFKTSKNPIFLSINVQSLPSKHGNLNVLINEFQKNKIDISVIALQEIWQIPHTESVQIPGFKFVHKSRAMNRGGGVGFYIKESLGFKVIQNLSPFVEKEFESITIETQINNKKTYLTSIYRSPNISNESLRVFNDGLDNLLRNLNSKNQKSYVFLDSNINLLNINNNGGTIEYLDTLLNNGFFQTIMKATRIQNTSSSLIDHILTNKSHNESTGTLISDISDHFFTFISHPSTERDKKPKNIESRNFSALAISNFKTTLGALSWETTLQHNDVNDSYNTFFNDFMPLFELHFPKTKKKFNKNYHKINDFMTTGLLTSRRTKNTLHKKSIFEPTLQNINKYKNYRNLFNTLLRKSKMHYFESNLNLHNKNPKKSWEILKEAIGKKTQSSISELSINGTLTNEPTAMANEFNNFFSGIGVKISNTVIPTDKDPISYINIDPNTPQLDLGGTGAIQIINILKKMDKKNSPDLDGISLALLKSIALEISIPLGHIFNLSLTNGVFPEKLKSSRVVPIFKAGDPTSCDNYRPISLVSAISKILEKTVAAKLTEHLESNNLLYEHQYGFLKGKSTEHNLLHLTNKIGEALNDDKYCIGIFLDLKKAFDVVSHSILLKKLKTLGINGTALKWFASYLKNRTQQVDINGNLSDSKNLDISVLQGTILGPILFLCYINDFPLSNKLLSFLFADDTSCTAADSNLHHLFSHVNTELQKIANWFRANRMAVNISKTKYIIFHRKGKKINLNGLQILFNENEIGKENDPLRITPLERIFNEHPEKEGRTYKLLGVHLDETLSFKNHIEIIGNKISKSLYCINRAKNFLSKTALKSLYFALIHPHLLYCINIYSIASSSLTKRLSLLQKRAIRIIHKTSYLAHTQELFIHSKILPLEKLIIQSKLMFMHSIEYGYGPPSFMNIWQKNFERNPNMNLRNANDYHLTMARTESFKKIPLYSLPNEWNNLEINLNL